MIDKVATLHGLIAHGCEKAIQDFDERYQQYLGRLMETRRESGMERTRWQSSRVKGPLNWYSTPSIPSELMSYINKGEAYKQTAVAREYLP